MNHNETIKYIKTHFKNMVDDKIKSIEHAIRTNLKKNIDCKILYYMNIA